MRVATPLHPLMASDVFSRNICELLPHSQFAFLSLLSLLQRAFEELKMLSQCL